MKQTRKFKVNIGPRRNKYFSTMEDAVRFCGEVFRATGIVLSIVENPKRGIQ